MSRYEASIPHVAFGIAAVAMTAITFGISVILPAKIKSDKLEPPMMAASKVTTRAVTGAVTDSASIDVTVLREPGLSAVPYALSQGNPNPDGGLRRLSQRNPNPDDGLRRLSQRNPNPEGGVRRSSRPGMRRGERVGNP